jgi:hypothetical protein
LENEYVNGKALNASFFVNWFFGKTTDYCLDLKKMSSPSIDTCATMQNTWTRLKKHLLLKHLFFVSCDSYSLQLLIKDILESQPFCNVIAVVGFRGPLQNHMILGYSFSCAESFDVFS